MSQCLAYDICEKVAERKNTDMTELPPLYHTIDPESLQQFVESVEDQSMTIEFIYTGYKITVSMDKTVAINKKSSIGCLQ